MAVPSPSPVRDCDDYPPLSALNDLLFCARRCYLHRVEGIWFDNVHTAAGSLDHRRVHTPRDAEEGPFRTARGLRLLSHRLRLVGVADLVEFRPGAGGAPEVPYPVEYKRGRKRKWDNNDVQLCAQAMCLEEMLDVAVPAGALYHVRSKRRQEVVFDAGLRQQTVETAGRLHELLCATVAPPPVLHPKCRQCSVHDVCMPELISRPEGYQRAAERLFSAPGE